MFITSTRKEDSHEALVNWLCKLINQQTKTCCHKSKRILVDVGIPPVNQATPRCHTRDTWDSQYSSILFLDCLSKRFQLKNDSRSCLEAIDYAHAFDAV